MGADTATPLAPDDLVTCLSKAAAALDRPPRIVTFSHAPVEHLMGQVFGPAASVNLVTPARSTVVGVAEWARPDGTAASPLEFPGTDFAVVARFMNPGVFERVALGHRGWLAGAAAVIVHFPFGETHGKVLSQAGFQESRAFAGPGRETTVFLRTPDSLSRGMKEPRSLDRPPMRRLVIVDPCLGGARGHFDAYAQRLTEGARARGAEVVWGCHERLADGVAPVGVEVRRCFSRSFFDLSQEELGLVDLSPELLAGWAALVGEFDDAGTHFLVHSAVTHLLAAAAGLPGLRGGMRSVVHLSFHTNPGRMTGRTVGEEAHRVVLRLRRAPQWERSLFLWTENRRLGRWMSQWLQAEIPTLPMLSPSAPGLRAPEGTAGGRLTLSVLGESRVEKGFLDLPELVDLIARAPQLRDRLKVVIQDWPSPRASTEPHEQAVDRLREHDRLVEIVEGRLDDDGYARRLAEADALLLPYRAHTYGLRGSGILVEGLSRGAVIVVRAGTSMQESSDDGVVLAYESPENLIEVLTGLVTTYEETSKRAGEMATRFREVNTPERYVAALDERARGQL